MNNLTARKKFQEAVKAGKTARELGFSSSTSTGDIIRFASRYRVAQSFQSITLEGFSKSTTAGYAALLKLFLAWSTFEQFLEITGQQQRDTTIEKLFNQYNATELCNEIRKYDKGATFYSFILSQVNKTHQAEIKRLLEGKELNSSYLASAIRHIFAHGKLSPHANKSNPKNVIRICNAISKFLLEIVDAEFSKRLDQVEFATK